MAEKPTVFVVTDIETTLKHRIAFDVAWEAIDRRGNKYGKGSYVVNEAFFHDVPFFHQKLGWYFGDTYNRDIKPMPMASIKRKYNRLIKDLKGDGHRVIFAAYNAGFDAKYLGETSQKLLGENFLDVPVEIMCIWHYWALSCPLDYTADLTASGKFYSTTAESVFRYEAQQTDFEERHIAFSDVIAEQEILLKVLKRKKPMPVYSSPAQLPGGIYRVANQRLGMC